MTQTHDKAFLRSKIMTLRGALSPEWRAQASLRILNRINTQGVFEGVTQVALFASFGHEVETHALITQRLAAGCRVALPIASKGEPRLQFRNIAAFPGDCTPGPYGILQPDPGRCPEVVDPRRLELIIVPALLFSPLGYRVGYGGGYYDRLLADAPQARKIGIAFSYQMEGHLPVEEHDQPVDAIATEMGWIDCKRQRTAG